MADTKISALQGLTGDVADDDELVIVDKSDTTMAPSGTTKRLIATDMAGAVFARPILATSDTGPSAGVKLFCRPLAGRNLLGVVGPSGLSSSLQATMARNAICCAFPNGNSNIISYLRLVLTNTGTVTTANVATTNLHARMKRVDYLVTAPSSSAVAGFRSAAAQFTTGNGADGGFFYVCRWAPATGQANASNRAWCGLRASTSAPTNVDPSAIVNAVGMGWDSGDSRVQFMHGDGVSPTTKIDLGASFARSYTDRSKVYELAMFSPPSDATVSWQVTDLTSGATATGVATTDAPSSTTLLAPMAYCSVGGTSSVIGLALMGLYIETDN